MTPRIEVASYRGLCVLLALVDTAVGAYLAFTPVSVFRQSAVWDGILGVVGTLAPIGWVFLAVSALAWVGFAGVPNVARIAFVAALGPWGAMLGSFVFAAWTLSGLGTMTAILSAAVLILHLASAGHFPRDYRC